KTVEEVSHVLSHGGSGKQLTSALAKEILGSRYSGRISDADLAHFRNLDKKSQEEYAYQTVYAKAQRGYALTTEDVEIIKNYQTNYPQVQIPERLQSAISRYERDQENQMTVGEKVDDAATGAIVDTVLGGTSYLITRDNGWASKLGYSFGTILDDAAGPLARSTNDAIRAAYTGTCNGIGNAIGSTVFGATVGSVIGMMQGDSPGQAIASSVMTTTFSYGLTQVAMLGAAAFLGATPVGWAAIGIGVAAGAVTSLLYNSDFMGMKSVAQDWGENMDETFSNIGTAFKNVGDFLWGG
ncbi:hypothetical protein ACVRXZ_00005, partial [Streptococcus oriscaviae]